MITSRNSHQGFANYTSYAKGIEDFYIKIKRSYISKGQDTMLSMISPGAYSVAGERCWHEISKEYPCCGKGKLCCCCDQFTDSWFTAVPKYRKELQPNDEN